ncbi:hypothetical protein Bca52824_013548 [Brassica carinata]|uniref:NAC domain-containing protein n=1 Tax=Brassica carinata TaxID=52824 RepID=A0A8X8B2K3_BRACI|nr:hypothetical protein Bca52824_013548 [Brassica carinata]
MFLLLFRLEFMSRVYVSESRTNNIRLLHPTTACGCRVWNSHPIHETNRAEIVNHYLKSKNMDGNTSHVDEVISTVDIYSFDPWELPSYSIRKGTDLVWYFFGRKDNRVERQNRKTKSGFWKKTGVTTDIMRKRGDSEKIGEKRVLVFHYSKILGGSKPKSYWVMHEYVATFLSPTQTPMVTYTICKVMFKGDASDLPSSSAFAGGGSEVEHDHCLITPMNNPGGELSSEEGSLFELQNPHQFSGFLHLEEETRIEDTIHRAINNLSPHDFDDDEEQGKTMFTQEDRNDYRPKKPLTGIFIGHSDDDDSDFDSISCSIHTSSACDSFRISNRPIDQITDLQKSPSSTIELVSVIQAISYAPGTNIDNYDDAQESEIGGDQKIKYKRAGFIHRMIQSFVNNIKLCSFMSRP